MSKFDEIIIGIINIDRVLRNLNAKSLKTEALNVLTLFPDKGL